MIAIYHWIKTPIGFWCMRGLNPISIIQSSEILPVEITKTHNSNHMIRSTTLITVSTNKIEVATDD